MINFIQSRIGRRIVVSFCALVLVLVGVGGWSLYRLALDQFERQMANHLVSVSLLIAEGLEGDVVEQIQPQYGLYDRLQIHIEQLRNQVGAARIAVLGRDGNRLLDTRINNAFGQPYARFAFDRDEIDKVWVGQATHSVAFYDQTGAAFQTGYAPIFRGDKVVALVAVDLGVGFIGAVETFQQSLFLLGIVGVLLTVVVGVVLSKTLTHPINQLVRSAQAIGQGDLEQVVGVALQDELGVLGQALDEMRQKLAARDEQLRQMLAGVAHEIRNPLGGIELYAGFIADDLDEKDVRREHILKVIGEVRNLNQVISDFLLFARPLTLEPEVIKLQAVVDDALFLLTPEIELAKIQTTTQFETDGDILADAGQIKGAVVNVVKNALQAMPNGGMLTVVLKNEGKHVVLKVIDTGKGISQEDQARIFEPFFTTKEQGSGLGLPIVREILERHRAKLEIESAVGKGTTVVMTFERIP